MIGTTAKLEPTGSQPVLPFLRRAVAVRALGASYIAIPPRR